VEGRQEALEKAAAELTPADHGPLDAATAAGLGTMLSCSHWPRTPVPPLPREHHRLSRVPLLLLGGDRDLSPHREWLYDRRGSSRGRVSRWCAGPRTGAEQDGERRGRAAVFDFLLKS
jgi:hypothetical protein